MARIDCESETAQSADFHAEPRFPCPRARSHAIPHSPVLLLPDSGDDVIDEQGKKGVASDQYDGEIHESSFPISHSIDQALAASGFVEPR